VSIEEAQADLHALDQEIKHLIDITAVLGWDQETYLPEGAVENRGEQLALLEGYTHRLVTSDKMAKALEILEQNPSPSPLPQDLVQHLGRMHHRSSKLPEDLVKRKAALVSRSQAAWAKARKLDRFEDFAPYLAEMVDITREIAQRIGYEDHPYTALLEEFEPGMDTRTVEKAFGAMEAGLSALVKAIAGQNVPQPKVLFRDYPENEQEKLGRFFLTALGFEWDRGRLDVTTHPFCTTLGSHDVRLTTRYERNYLPTSIYGMIHEAGHGMYELGFAEEIHGSSLATGTSLGIHESQSRFWENIIGRSEAFVGRYFDQFVKHFPHLADQTPRSLYEALNHVEPSFIRVEADEVTYGLHIILRFGLEKALVSGDLEVKDLPEVWDGKFEELFGIRPGSNQEGVLQDIHWAMGAIGYFPTYALGNLYGAQFTPVLEQDLGDLNALVSQGEFGAIKNWLRQKIHRHGSRVSGAQLIQDISGEALDGGHFLAYLQKKYRDLYGI
jgi:carboxypeptidase Taq